MGVALAVDVYFLDVEAAFAECLEDEFLFVQAGFVDQVVELVENVERHIYGKALGG